MIGTFQSLTVKTAKKSGKSYGSADIDGNAYLVFGNALGIAQSMSPGDQVEYSSKSTDDGSAEVITFIKRSSAVSNNGVATKTTEAATQNPTVRVKTSVSDSEKQASVLFSYAKDIVLGNKVRCDIATPTAVADVVATTATELARQFKKFARALGDMDAVTSDPTLPLEAQKSE